MHRKSRNLLLSLLPKNKWFKQQKQVQTSNGPIFALNIYNRKVNTNEKVNKEMEIHQHILTTGRDIEAVDFYLQSSRSDMNPRIACIKELVKLFFSHDLFFHVQRFFLCAVKDTAVGGTMAPNYSTVNEYFKQQFVVKSSHNTFFSFMAKVSYWHIPPLVGSYKRINGFHTLCECNFQFTVNYGDAQINFLDNLIIKNETN